MTRTADKMLVDYIALHAIILMKAKLRLNVTVIMQENLSKQLKQN